MIDGLILEQMKKCVHFLKITSNTAQSDELLEQEHKIHKKFRCFFHDI